MIGTIVVEDERRRPQGAAPLALDDAHDASRCGHKAATLAALRKAGHDVPDGFVIPVDGDASPSALADALARLGPGPYAVRSSGVAEDLADASFAGQYETVLGVATLEAVAEAAARVRASGLGERAAAYRAYTHAERAPLGVLVQRQIAPDVAGVVFSANPLTGDDEVVIEVVRGLGDRLMEGDQDGDRWIGRGQRVEATVDTGVLDSAMARRLVDLARRIARERGCPQDVELAIVGTEIYVLQARPIVALPVRPEIEFPPGRWQKDVGHFTGPMSPFGVSVLLPVYEAAMEVALADFGMPLKTIRQRAFGGEVYTQDVDLSGEHDPGAPPPWWLLAVLVRVIPSVRRRLKVAEQGIARLTEYPRLWERRWRDECWKRIEAARAIEPRSLTDEQLVRELDRVIDEVLLPHMTIHFQLTVPGIVGVYELHRACAELLGWDEAQAMELLTGASTATTAGGRELARIAAQIDDEALDAGLDAVRASAAGAELEAWSRRWGLRTIDADPGSPQIGERDELILGLLRRAKRAPDEDALGRLQAKRHAAIAAARAKLGAAGRARFDEALAYAEIVYPQRDDNVELTEGLPCGLVRRLLLEIGARLVRAGRLIAPGDVVFLDKQELCSALTSELRGETARARVRRRRAERAWVLAHPGPMLVGPPPVPEPDVRGLPTAARRLLKALSWAIAHELAAPVHKASEDGALQGVGVSPGTYTGPARIIATEADLERLRPGDVLVCPTTHSSWTVVFGHAGALVMDGGGILSHPAIIAREHGIPAVASTSVATTRLRDGDQVRVDGNTGRVELV
ncbi:MAG: hypothetical protein IT379_09195 [Deltaproteobacteria bacterium]|nr:hypothetical protein [Deltaproteobacteria bacterium]